MVERRTFGSFLVEGGASQAKHCIATRTRRRVVSRGDVDMQMAVKGCLKNSLNSIVFHITSKYLKISRICIDAEINGG